LVNVRRRYRDFDMRARRQLGLAILGIVAGAALAHAADDDVAGIVDVVRRLLTT